MENDQIVNQAPINMEQSSPVSSVPVGSIVSVSYAGFWLRFIALLVDGFILGFIYGIIGFLYGWLLVKYVPSLGDSAKTVIEVLSFFVWIVYDNID